MDRTKRTVVPTLLLALALAPGCRGGDNASSTGAWAEPLALEGPRNETLALVAEETGVPLQVLYVLGYQQSRFEDPEVMLDTDMSEDVSADVDADLLGLEIPWDDERAVEEPDLYVEDEDGMVVPGLEDFVDELAEDPTTEDFVADEDLTIDPSEIDGEPLPAGDSALEADEESDPHFHPDLAGVFLLTDAQRADAVRLTGLTDEDLLDDLEANARAAAAVLVADLASAGITPVDATHRDWEDVMLRFVGFDPSEEGAVFFRADLDQLLTEGFDHVTSDGERLLMLRSGGAALDIGDPWADDDEVIAESDTGETGVTVEEVRGYPAIEFIAASSSNYSSRNGQSIRYVVIHDIEGTMAGAVATFRNPGRGASAHYVIRARDGHIVQMVPEASNAWHCGHGFFNRSSIGIEHEGFADRPNGGGYYTERQYRASAELVGAIARRYRIPVDRRHVFGHGNVPSSTSSTTLCSDAASVSGRCGGVSHHHDPGRYWDWRLYMGLVARYASGGSTPAPAPTPPRPPRPTELRAISTGWGGQRVVRDAAGAVHVFGVDARHRLVENVRTGSDWSGFRVVTAAVSLRGYPAAIVDGDRIVVAARGSDDAVHLVRGNTGHWSAPIALPGLTINAMPSLFVNRDGRAEVFVRGTNGELWHAAERSPGGDFGRWWSLGGELRTMPTVVADRDGDPHVFAIGDRAGHVFHRERTSPTSWPSWRYLEARGNAPVSPIVMPDGRLAVFTRDAQGRLVQQFQDRANGPWRRARTIGGRITSNLVAVLDARGRVNVFGRGRDAAVYRVVRNAGGRWGTFARLGGRVTMGPAPVLGPNGLEVFVAGRNHALYSAAQTRATRSGWTGWRARGGRLGWL